MNKNLKYWLAMNKIDKLGPISIKRLYDHFGSIEKGWQADEKEIAGIEGLRRDAIKSFIENRTKIDLATEINKLKDVKVLCLEDSEYPSSLKNIYDPPPVIYIKGNLLPADSKAIAIVGTRKASRYGLEMAKKFAEGLSSLGITIVSGLALGIDTAAHQGTLQAKGRTLAVLGSGVDTIYPSSNKQLAAEVEKSGAVISEFPLGAKPDTGSFPRRNRIISGLSLGTIVIEGGYDSGAMITAKYALDQGREVFAVPGNIEQEQSKGPHWLIKQGAKLVESVEDVLEELRLGMPKMTNDQCQMTNERVSYPELNEDEKKIVSLLSVEAKHLDSISAQSGLPIPQVSSLLMMMEIKKVVRQLPGKMFSLV
ncbi:MAG: DNA-processing protein DprA [Candidatus Margulisbacteria bacterium]|nr:DNA-processing protein DprA [Candidatus Margulisiibacteriota bacterium]